MMFYKIKVQSPNCAVVTWIINNFGSEKSDAVFFSIYQGFLKKFKKLKKNSNSNFVQ